MSNMALGTVKKERYKGTGIQIESTIQLELSPKLCHLIDGIQDSSFFKRIQSNYNTRGMLKYLIKLYYIECYTIPPRG